jgi:hypothetical protein
MALFDATDQASTGATEVGLEAGECGALVVVQIHSSPVTVGGTISHPTGRRFSRLSAGSAVAIAAI